MKTHALFIYSLARLVPVRGLEICAEIHGNFGLFTEWKVCIDFDRSIKNLWKSTPIFGSINLQPCMKGEMGRGEWLPRCLPDSDFVMICWLRQRDLKCWFSSQLLRTKSSASWSCRPLSQVTGQPCNASLQLCSRWSVCLEMAYGILFPRTGFSWLAVAYLAPSKLPPVPL